MDQRMFLFILFSAMGVALLVLGIFSLQSLTKASRTNHASDERDPLLAGRLLSVLLSTHHEGVTLRRLQKRTIWLFCGSMLLLFVARQMLIASNSQ